MGHSKIIYRDEVLLDLSADTVTDAAVRDGVKYHDSNGDPRVGGLKSWDGSNAVIIDMSLKDAYISFGDSIAAGHAINAEWEENYGTRSQYGNNGNTYTAIVPGCYTALIENDIIQRADGRRTYIRSFAKSGDKVSDLIRLLDDPIVKESLISATIVTVCIGANDILQPALENIDSYINYGTPALGEISRIVDTNLAILNDDSNANSYRALINKLKSINSSAKYVFTNIYNPFKYLHLDESTSDGEYLDGFFGPLMWALPSNWGAISTTVRASLYNTDIVQTVMDRFNILPDWVENYITQLNTIIQEKVASSGSNFAIANTKGVFDSVPDRMVPAELHYNDLVNVEFTRGYVIEDLDWGQFWKGFTLADILGDGVNAVMSNIVRRIVSEVILPDLDPHPEESGQYAMKKAFTDALGWENLNRYNVYYNSNGGSGVMQSKQLLMFDSLPAYIKLPNNAFTGAEGYVFTGWNINSDGSGSSYLNGQVIPINADTTLYAQWSNMIRVVYRHSNDSDGHYTSSDTGHMEDYALAINGVMQDKLGSFSNPSVEYSIPYGTSIAIAVTFWKPSILYTSAVCDIYWNGVSVADNESNRPSGDYGNIAYYEFALNKSLDIEFRAKYRTSGLLIKEFWDCYITEL